MGIRHFRVEQFAGPEKHNEIPRTDILYGVCVSRRNINYPEFLSPDTILQHSAARNVTKTDHRLAFKHAELLNLCVVIMITT